MQASPFKYKPRRSEAYTLKEMLNRAQSFINWVEKINTQFDNSIVVDTFFSRPTWKDYHWRKDQSGRGMHEKYDKYTSLNASQEKIYQECANTKESGTHFPSKSHLERTRQNIVVSTRVMAITPMIVSN